MRTVPRYVPVLKGKLGEFSSLRRVDADINAGILPLVEVIPEGERDDPAAIRIVCEKAAKRLGDNWGTNAALVDAGLLELSVESGNGMTATELACRHAEQWEVRAIPAVRLDDGDRAWSDVGVLHAEFGRGVGIRLVGEDLDEDGEDVDEMVDARLTSAGLHRGEADLLLDAGPIDGEVAALGVSRLMTALLKSLDKVHEWRSVTVVSGAFPNNLGMHPAWVVGEYARYDADVWAHVMNRRRLPRAPDFGDYAIAHPVLPVGNVGTPAPQLRYTASDRWLTIRAKKNDPRGYAQIFEICERIAEHPDFAGAALGWADSWIENKGNGRTGNATTWRQVGTTHHLDFVTRRLATLGEP
jgi:Beta protein